MTFSGTRCKGLPANGRAFTTAEKGKFTIKKSEKHTSVAKAPLIPLALCWGLIPGLLPEGVFPQAV
jgi:hypothetical protein